MDIFKYKLNKILFLASIGMPQIMPAAAPDPFGRMTFRPARIVQFSPSFGPNPNPKDGPRFCQRPNPVSPLWRRIYALFRELLGKINRALFRDSNNSPRKEPAEEARAASRILSARSEKDIRELRNYFGEHPGLDTNWQDANGRTLPIFAVATRRLEVVEAVLKAMLNLQGEHKFALRDNIGRTALDYARINRNPEIENALLAAGASDE